MNFKLVESLLTEKFAEEEFHDCFLVDVEYSNVSNKLQVFIDSDSDFGFTKCRRISRHLENYIDENDVLGTKYTLEVSSPGLSRPLKYVRQYVKNKGRMLKVTLEDDGKLEGKIEDVDNNRIVLEIKNIKRSINFETIKSAQLVPSFK
ncbi:MAG: ribosome maturation factor [Saprospiraceae bacterium]